MITCKEEADALYDEERCWKVLRDKAEEDLREYLEQASEEALWAEYGYYLEDAESYGETPLSFEEWQDSRLPEYA